MRKLRTLEDIVDYSNRYTGNCIEVGIDFDVTEYDDYGDNPEIFAAYAAVIANNEFMLYTDKACLTYVVDEYNGKLVCECLNIDRD